MKYRNGFVSNSSSTSFLIEDLATEDDISFTEILKGLESARRWELDSEDTHLEASGKDMILSCIINRWGDDEWNEALAFVKNYSESESIHFIEINYHDGFGEIFHKFEKKGLLKILWEN